jgi:hypothetical protein
MDDLKARRAEVRALLKDNIKDTFKFEMWPWVQAISTILFLIFIWLGDPWTDRAPIAYLGSFIWIAIQLFAMFKFYESEKI